MTGREAGRLEKVEVEVMPPGGLRSQWLTQVCAYMPASGPLGVQLVPGVDKGLCGKPGMVIRDEEDIKTSGSLERHPQI